MSWVSMLVLIAMPTRYPQPAVHLMHVYVVNPAPRESGPGELTKTSKQQMLVVQLVAGVGGEDVAHDAATQRRSIGSGPAR